jgi:hypothetical protein
MKARENVGSRVKVPVRIERSGQLPFLQKEAGGDRQDAEM